jgi:hypothetical protein
MRFRFASAGTPSRTESPSQPVISGEIVPQPQLGRRSIPYDPISELRWSARIEEGLADRLAKDRRVWEQLERGGVRPEGGKRDDKRERDPAYYKLLRRPSRKISTCARPRAGSVTRSSGYKTSR